MKNIYKIILSLVGAGTITTAGIVTANKIMDNNRGEDMKNTVETMSIVSQNEVEEKENENQIENIVEETSEVSNESEETETITVVPMQNELVTENKEPVVEQEKEIQCIIDIVSIAKNQGWEEEKNTNTLELKLDGEVVYNNDDVQYLENFTINIKGKGSKVLTVIAGGGVIKCCDVNFNIQTNITIP